MLTQRASNPRVQPDQLKVAAYQFQPAVRSELFVTELDRKLSLDRPPQPPYLQPHLWGLSCRLELRCCRTPKDAPEAPFLRSNPQINRNYLRIRASTLVKETNIWTRWRREGDSNCRCHRKFPTWNRAQNWRAFRRDNSEYVPREHL